MAWSPPATDEAVNTWSPPKKDKEVGWIPPDAPHFEVLGEPSPLSFDESKRLLSWIPPQADPVQGPREPTDIERRSEAGLQGLPPEIGTAILMGAGTDPISAAAGRGVVAGAKMFGEGVANLAGRVLTPEAEMLLAKGQPIIEKMAASGEPAAVLSQPAGGFASIVRAPGIKELGPSGISSYVPGKVAQAAETAAAAEAAQTADPLLSQKVGAAMEGAGPATTEGSSGLLGGSKATISPLETPSGKVSLPGIRPEKFASDAERAMAEEVIARIPEDKLKQAGANPRTWAQTQAEATRTGWTKDTVLNLPLSGKAYTPNQLTQIGNVFANENEKLIALKMAAEESMKVPESAVTKAVQDSYVQQLVDTMKIGIVRSGASSTAGRTLNALKMQMSAIDDVTARLASKLSQATPEVRELVLKQLSVEGNDPAKVVEILQKLDKWSVRRMFAEWATTAKLWSPHTDMINVGTEAMNIAWDIPVKALSGFIDKVGDPILTKIYGEGRQRWAAEALADVKGMAAGVRVGGMKAFQALLHPEDVSAMLEGRGGQSIAIKGRPGQNTWVDQALDMVGKGARLAYAKLGIEDIFLKSIAEQGQIRAFTYRQVMKEGLLPGTEAFAARESELLANPALDLLEQAGKSADVMIFREKSGTPIRLMQELTDRVPEARLVIPFIKIGPNLVRESLKKGPGTLLLPSSYKDMLERGPAMDVIANAVLGTAALAPFVYHASKGRITLDAPTDRFERDKFFADGNQPNSIIINGYAVPVSRLSPFGEFVTTGARLWKMIENKDMDKADALLAKFAVGQVSNYANKTFLQGLNDTLEAVMHGERYGMKFLKNLATSSIIPSPVGMVARAIDPTYRKQETVGDAFTAKIPGMSQSLLPQRGLFGEEQQRPGSTARRLLSPIVPSVVKEEPVRKFLADNNLKVEFPPDRLNGRKLSNEEQDAVSAYAGPLIKNFILANQRELEGLAKTGQLKEAQAMLNAEQELNRKPVSALLVLPSELRALKIDSAAIPKPTLDMLDNYIKTDTLYKSSHNDAWKRDTLQKMIDAHKAIR